MDTVVIGVRHKTAPIAVREKLAFSKDELPDALREMLTLPGIEECAILATCNRTEVYATVTDTEIGLRSLKAFLNDYKGFDYNAHMSHAFILFHEDAVMHLFRVASGLDSLIMGEGQIMAQIKETLKTSMAARASGEVVEKIFKTALSVGKAVRAETGIADRDASVARAAFEFAQAHHPEFLAGKIALIGAGKMAEILLSSLKAALPAESRPADQVVMVNRSPERVKALSQKYGFPGHSWDSLESAIHDYDTLFVATSSPHTVLHQELFEEWSRQGGRPKVIIDISVPRNVDPVVGQIPGIYLYNTDDLSETSGISKQNRVRIIQQAHQIIAREYRKYHQWVVSRSAAPMITQLRNQVEDIRRNEIAGIEAHCPHTEKSCNVIDDLSRTLVNKILHNPTVQLRATPQLDEIYRHAEFLSHLFSVPVASCGAIGKDAAPQPNVIPISRLSRS